MTAPVQVGPSPQDGGPTPSTPHLTPRQLQVLRYAANGCTNKEIGRRLHTTEDTVKSQMAVILRRLHVEDRAQAVAVGIRLGLVSLNAITVSPRPERAQRARRTASAEPKPPASELDDELADIGDRIRAERQARGWTESDLARRAGLARVTVRRAQDGVGSLRVFLQVCGGLGVEVSYLLSDRWVMPARRPSLTATQARVLAAVADGRSLSQAAVGLCMTTEGLSSVLTQVYRRLGVTHVPRGAERRAAAVRVAKQHGLIDAA